MTKQNNRMQIHSMQLTMPRARRRHVYNLRYSGYVTPLVSGSDKTKMAEENDGSLLLRSRASSRLVQQHAKFCGYQRYIRLSAFIVQAQKFYLYLGSTLSGHLSSFMVNVQDGVIGDFIICLLAFFNIFIYLFI